MQWVTKQQMREHRAKLRKIERAGERKLLRDELKSTKEQYWPKKKWPSTSKMAMWYILGTCTVVQIYSMVAMWHFGDLSALYSLIGATVGEGITFCAYAAKSAKENTKGGIVHDTAMKAQEQAQESPGEAQNGAAG